MKSPTRSPAIKRAMQAVQKLGWKVEFREYCEDAEFPGLLGKVAGMCLQDRKVIRVKTHGMNKAQIAAAISHELEHAQGKERGTNYPELGLHCGGTTGGAPWAT